MPISVERATQKPTHVCITHHWHTLLKRYTSGLVNTHHGTSTVASSLTEIEIYQISKRQEQALVNALIIYMIPTAKKLLMSISSPPFAGFCMADDHLSVPR